MQSRPTWPTWQRPVRSMAASGGQEITVPLTSITYAIKAQNALRARGIRSNITRDERYYSNKSCGYALTLRAGTDMGLVMSILNEANIKLADTRGEGGS